MPPTCAGAICNATANADPVLPIKVADHHAQNGTKNVLYKAIPNIQAV